MQLKKKVKIGINEKPNFLKILHELITTCDKCEIDCYDY